MWEDIRYRKFELNRELEEMSKGENIVKWIKGQRISLLGHLERTEEDRMPKKIFTQELEGTRRRRRPRKGSKEKVERDLQVLGVRRWRELVTGKNGRILFDRPNPQRAVVPMDEEEEHLNCLYHLKWDPIDGNQLVLFRFCSVAVEPALTS
jgi:hypothetical protein